MRAQRKKYLLCLLTVWLMVSMASSPASAAWKYVPEGWTTPDAGYFGTEQDGRDTLEALRTYREEATAWEAAYNALKAEFDTLRAELDMKFAALEKSLDKEREAWKGEIRKAKGPGFGIFAGYGFDSHGDGNFVIGAGIVWKIF
ncbi:MAG TPA: hypothetical protein DIC53_03045 [Synergistaceae bacterium]|nr:hypothetical protein [Synergistaceae bacterium]